MSDEDMVTIRLSRSRAEFLELNVATMLERTREAVSNGGSEERRTALGRRVVALATIHDALRGALIDCSEPKSRGYRSSSDDEVLALAP